MPLSFKGQACTWFLLKKYNYIYFHKPKLKEVLTGIESKIKSTSQNITLIYRIFAITEHVAEPYVGG